MGSCQSTTHHLDGTSYRHGPHHMDKDHHGPHHMDKNHGHFRNNSTRHFEDTHSHHHHGIAQSTGSDHINHIYSRNSTRHFEDTHNHHGVYRSIGSVYPNHVTRHDSSYRGEGPSLNCLWALKENFPGAIPSTTLCFKVQTILQNYGFVDDSTLFATSLCCDEVNRHLEKDFTDLYGPNFSMGGLAGFCFGGVTAFAAMVSHIPDKGDCLVLYGPHVGIDSNGTVGLVNRKGRHTSGSCCGSAQAAMTKVLSVNAPRNYAAMDLDRQQSFVTQWLTPQAYRLKACPNSAIELPFALFDIQDTQIKQIVSQSHCMEGKIALLGGIQINTPDGTEEYFLPKVFEIRNQSGNKIADLLDTLQR